MTLGSKSQCRGWLLGRENQGMPIMFHMMNEARLGVGFQAFTYASAAYQYAVNYARQRIQGRDLTAGKDPNSPGVPIIRHPDVRRMLIWMKAHVEGMRSLIYYVGACLEKISLAATEAERAHYQGLADLFTPLVKAYCAQRGFEVCVQAMQVYGGYGYTREYPIEQLVRDAKIASIYEGTDGIQAMDLLGRKLGMKRGDTFMDFLAEIQKTVTLAREKHGLEEAASEVERAANRLAGVALNLGKIAMSPEVRKAFAFAYPFLEVMGDVIMAWMLLWRASLATAKLDKGAGRKDMDFYRGQIKSAEYFIHAILPGTLGKMDAIGRGHAAAVEIGEAEFGG
jgi:hypothetical protein